MTRVKAEIRVNIDSNNHQTVISDNNGCTAHIDPRSKRTCPTTKKYKTQGNNLY